jgi:hypothetical protein
VDGGGEAGHAARRWSSAWTVAKNARSISVVCGPEGADDRPMVDDGDAVGDAGHLVQVVAGDQHAGAGGGPA